MWLAVSCQVTQIIIYYYTALLQFSHSHPQYYTPRALTSREASLLKTIFSFFIFRSSDIFGPVWNFLAVKTQAYNNLVFMFSFFVIFQEKSSLFISGRPGSPCVEAEQGLPATPLAKRLSKRKQLFRCLVLQTDELFESGNLFLWRIVPWCDARYHPPRGLTLWLGPHAQAADDEHQSHLCASSLNIGKAWGLTDTLDTTRSCRQAWMMISGLDDADLSLVPPLSIVVQVQLTLPLWCRQIAKYLSSC